MKICKCHIEFVYDNCDVYTAAAELNKIIADAVCEMRGHIVGARLCLDYAERENNLTWDDKKGGDNGKR